MTIAPLIDLRNTFADTLLLVVIASVCPELNLLLWSIASSKFEFTTLRETMESKYSVLQSSFNRSSIFIKLFYSAIAFYSTAFFNSMSIKSGNIV